MKLISQSEYARRKGVSKQRVSQWVKQGTIKLVEEKVDPKQADRDLRNNLDHGRRMDYDLRIDVRKPKPKLKPQRGKKNSYRVWSEDLGIFLDFGPYLTKKGKVRK